MWTKELLKHVPDAQVWPDRVTDLDAVKFMIVMKQPEGLLEKVGAARLAVLTHLVIYQLEDLHTLELNVCLGLHG